MLKRGFDLVTASIGFFVLSPLLLLIALAVRLDSAGPVLHRARRVGRHEREYTLYKFRSMVLNAEKQGPGITVSGDRRVTSLGRILRKTKLDELPQLINVIRGEMSIVGPRPEDPRFVACYTAEQRAVLSVRPGITSLASIAYRSEETLLVGTEWERIYVEQVMPAKLALDLRYIQKQSLWLDLTILAQTAVALFR